MHTFKGKRLSKRSDFECVERPCKQITEKQNKKHTKILLITYFLKINMSLTWRHYRDLEIRLGSRNR